MTKHTILTEKRLKDIEDIIVTSGRIVTTDNIHKALSNKYTKFTLKKRIYDLKEKGWLVPLKRGLYFVADITSRGFLGISPFVIANAFIKDSYISLESGLSFYNLFEQMLRITASITAHKSIHYEFQDHTYRFLKIKSELYFGFRTEALEGYYIKIAELEKLILDFIYFRNDTYSIDLIIEKMQKAKDLLDLEKLFSYAQKFPVTTKRKLGFILDLFSMDTKKLHRSLSKKGFSKLTSNSKIFNSKWRIYYEDRFAQ